MKSNAQSPNGWPSLSVQTILESKTPSLISTSRRYGEHVAFDVVLAILNDFLTFLGQDIPTGAKNEVVRLILAKYPNYQPETVRLCFERIKTGHFGTIYGQVNGMAIMEFFGKFDVELDGEIVELRATESEKNKKNNDFVESIFNPISYDEKCRLEFLKIKQTLEKIGKSNELKEKESKSEISIKAEPDQIQLWIREFDDLYKSTGNLSGTVKSVEYNGNRLFLLGFLNEKRNELKNEN
jgi:hypothetical protein